MRIVQVCHAFPPHIGGLENFVHSMSMRLRQRGHDVSVLTTSAGASPGDGTETSGVRVLRQACWNGFERRQIPWPIVFPTGAATALRLLKEADIVHVHGILFQNSVLACSYCRVTNKPLVVTEHVGIVPYRSMPVLFAEMAALWSLGRAVVRLADAVIVVNRLVADQVAHLRGFRGEISIVPYGVDTELFRPVRSREEREAIRRRLGWDDRPRVVSVGRLTAKKGMEVLLAAADPSYEIVLCGPGPVPPLPPHASALGALRREEVADVLRAADVFCLMSVGEGFPLAVQEAMATALPLVMTDDPRYWAYLKRTEVAMVPQDPAKVRAAIRRYIDDHDTAARAGMYGYATVQRLFSWETVLDAHERLYEKVRRRLRGRPMFGAARYDLASLERVVELGHLAATENAAGRALDIGTGNGFVQSEVLNGSPRIVVDVHAPNLRLCRRLVDRAGAASVLAVQAAADRLPFPSGTFRTVLCAEVLEHCEDDRAVVAEIARVLEEGGALLLSVPGLRFGFDSCLHVVGLKTVHDVDGPERHYRAGYPLHVLKPLLEEYGLMIEEVREYTGPLTRVVLDGISLANLTYQRFAHGKKAFTWSDVAESERGIAFQIYRALFPLLRAVVAIDRNLPFPRGFQLAVRARRVSDASRPGQFEWSWDRTFGMSIAPVSRTEVNDVRRPGPS